MDGVERKVWGGWRITKVALGYGLGYGYMARSPQLH